MIKWLRTLWLCVRDYKLFVEHISQTNKTLTALEERIRVLTTVSADIGLHPKAANWAIVVGRYRNTDYVQTVSLTGPDFAALVEQLRYMRKIGVIQYLDAPPSIRATILRDESNR